MVNIAVVGAQWGDEGKGKVVDLLAGRVQVVARYNGGHNAGHTVCVEGRRFVLHLLPSGILHEGVLCVMGNGMVVDPWELEEEMRALRGQGVTVEDNLVLSDRAHLVLPHHRALERAAEEERAERRIDTTLRGIGPAYEDKAARRGLRVVDLLRPERLPDRLAEARGHYEKLLRGGARAEEVDWDSLVDELAGLGARLRRHVADVSVVLQRQMARGYAVLFEGAQATLLDLDHGSYPFVTSSSCSAGGVLAGLGVPPTRLDGVLGVLKAYTTRVGAGPLPTQIGGPLEDEVRKRGAEFGATTGRPRRCGWFDAVVARSSARVNGFDSLAVTKLDVLDGLPEVKLATAYRLEGETLTEMPADLSVLEACEPVYETLPGWQAPTTAARGMGDLPAPARRYLDRLAELAGAEVGLVSTGPDRDQVLWRRQSRLAAWFE
jgi:adenylosuccinate synthase